MTQYISVLESANIPNRLASGHFNYLAKSITIMILPEADVQLLYRSSLEGYGNHLIWVAN